MLRVVIPVSTITLLLSACAPNVSDTASQTTASLRPCFTQPLRGYTTLSPETVHLDADNRRVFVAQSVGVCNDLDSALSLAVAPEIGSGSICVGDYARVTVSGQGAFTMPCRVRITEVLTKDQARAAAAAAKNSGRAS